MQKFNVSIEEHLRKTFTIDADTLEEAMKIAEIMYKKGDIALDTASEVRTKLMSGYDPVTYETTEWVEF